MNSARACDDLVLAVVQFCRLLRLRGVRLHSDAAQTALAALREIDVTERNDFRTTLRIALVQRPEDLAPFAYFFNLFWGTGRPAGEANRAADSSVNGLSDAERLGEATPEAEAGAEEALSSDAHSRITPGREAAHLPDDSPIRKMKAAMVGGGRREGEVPGLAASEAAELERLARELAPILATRRSRRWMRTPRGSSIDLRKALRSSLRYGGTPIELPRRARRMTRTRLVIFCDVSRSMDEDAAFFLRFAAAVLRRLWKVEVFLFATDIVRVTPLWLRESWSTLLLRVPDCGGGTRIGACLARFLEEHERSLVGGDTIVMIFSDGLDAGDPMVLDLALERLGRRSRAICWLNPLSHLEGYEPTAQGMAVALRHLDVFAPAHDLASLSELVRDLRVLRAA